MGKINVVVKENYILRTLIKDSYGTYHAIIYRDRPQDYVFCWHYDITDGTWGQGHYCSTFFQAWTKMCTVVGTQPGTRLWTGDNVKVH